MRDAWIEINPTFEVEYEDSKSHPVRDAWIEIQPVGGIRRAVFVASREGCVD